jgi:hypothetical protein
MDMKHDTSSGAGRQLQEGTAIAGLKSAVKQRSETFEEDIRDNTARLDESTDHRNLANDQRDDGPELSLPFIGYTLKRFDDYNQARAPPVVPTSRNSVQTTECFVSPSQLSSPHQARVLQDYQMSLLLLDHQNKRRTMQARRTSGTAKDLESASPGPFKSDNSGSVISQRQSSKSKTMETDSVTEASRPKSREQMSSDGDFLLHPCSEQDILQNFDFDSFLLQDEEVSEFRLPPVTGPSDLPASDTPQTPVHSSFYFPAAEADPPTYINAKQFYRILKRRYARQVLEEESAARDTRLLLSKRRHEEEGENPDSKKSTTQSSDTKSTPFPVQVLAQGNKPKLQLGDPKRLRNPGASARFRARRREKERKAAEEAITEKKNGSKGSNESLPGPSSPDLSFTLSPAEVEKPPVEPLSPPINPSTCHSPTVSSCSPSTKPSFRPDACLSLSTLQQSKLWWRSYASIRLSNSPAFEVLCFGIFNELGILTSCTSHDEKICRQISADFKRFDEIDLSYRQKEEGLADILEMRSNVLRIVKTIDEQLGLQVATLGWSCVCVFLRVSSEAPITSLSSITKSVRFTNAS